MRCTDLPLTRQRINRCQAMLRHLTVITGSERGCSAFFQQFHSHIEERVAALMKGIDQATAAAALMHQK